MSHITQVKTQITDLAVLQAAVEEKGWQWMEGQRTHQYYARSAGRCDHAIRIPGAKYEVGVVNQGDGTYSIAYDSYGPGGLRPHLGYDAAPLIQAYATHKTIREVARLGHRIVAQQVLADGSVRVTVERGL